MTTRLMLAVLVMFTCLFPARANFTGEIDFPLSRPRPFTGAVTVAGTLELEIPPGDEAAPVEIRALYVFDDAPGLLAALLSPETGVLGIADVASYCGMRSVAIVPSAEGVSVDAEMCVDIKLFGIKLSGYQRASMTLAITPDEDSVEIRCSSINIRKVSGDIDRALCSAIKPFEWRVPVELGALKPKIASATLRNAGNGKIGIALIMTVDPSAATNEEWRRLLRFALEKVR
jgi:hypothetical protein